MKKGYIYTIVFMLAVSVFFTAILATTDTLLKDRIDTNKEFAAQQAILDSLGIEGSNDPAEVARIFEEQLVAETFDDKTYYRQVDADGETVAYSVPYVGSGLWGTIRGYIGVSEDLKTMQGIVFTEQNETPGLGGRIQESAFRDQFRGMDISQGAPESYGTYGGVEIDAITGATGTSNAILGILQEIADEVLPELATAIGLE